MKFKTLDELDETLAEILASDFVPPNTFEPSTIERLIAHQEALRLTTIHIYKYAEKLMNIDWEFQKMMKTLLNSENMRSETKVKITIELVSYWITGEKNQARDLYHSLFTKEHKEHFQASD